MQETDEKERERERKWETVGGRDKGRRRAGQARREEELKSDECRGRKRGRAGEDQGRKVLRGREGKDVGEQRKKGAERDSRETAIQQQQWEGWRHKDTLKGEGDGKIKETEDARCAETEGGIEKGREGGHGRGDARQHPADLHALYVSSLETEERAQRQP